MNVSGNNNHEVVGHVKSAVAELHSEQRLPTFCMMLLNSSPLENVISDQRPALRPDIAMTNLRSDLVMWSNSCCRVLTVEPSGPWEDTFNEAHETKQLCYANLEAESEESGCRVMVHWRWNAGDLSPISLQVF